MEDMASGEGRRHRHNLVPLAALISREMRSEKMEKPTVRYAHAAQSRKGEDYFLIKTDCQRVPGNSSSTFSVFAVTLILCLSTSILPCHIDWYPVVQLCYMPLSHDVCTEFMTFRPTYYNSMFFNIECFSPFLRFCFIFRNL
jgi:hypothetical protein